ncbi:peptidase inhibitor family I36 protein [Nocardiopsis lucentensis]|uniref:peptidase inhibitor family I36 protein n=1 Tax=Nocardiopsis lucentensis TaxID=53441 RepID=UPI000346AC7F|nr:peptidase inhibitor family I36 protein [Nocardiopsis lucentensis]
MKRKITTAGVMASIALAGVFGIAPAASAAVDGSCGGGEFCLYENTDYNKGNTPNVYQWTGSDRDYNNNRWYNAADREFTNDVLDNEASSVWNRTGCDVTLYQHVGYGGANTTFDPGDSDGYLANNSVGDNRASAHKFKC